MKMQISFLALFAAGIFTASAQTFPQARLPHLAAGGDVDQWVTTIRIYNNTTEVDPMQVTVYFYDANGQPLALTMDGTTVDVKTDRSLSPGMTQDIVLSDPGATPKIGYAVAQFTTQKILPITLFYTSTKIEGAITKKSAASDYLTSPTSDTILFDNTNGHTTSIAISQSVDSTQNVMLNCKDEVGTRLGQVTEVIPKGQMYSALELRTVIPQLDGHKGMCSTVYNRGDGTTFYREAFSLTLRFKGSSYVPLTM